MGIQVAINHRTSYEYDRQVILSPHTIRLRPAPHCRTPVRSYSLRIDPPEHFLNWQQDPHGNYLARAVFQTPARRLRVEVDLVAELTVINPFDFFLESAETFPFEYEPWLARDLRPFLETETPGPELRKFLAAVDIRPRRTVDFLVALNEQTQRRVDYVIRMEPGIQTCDETLARGSGSCRDSAWLLVHVLRQMGLAARFVSGYLIQLVPDVKPSTAPPVRSATSPTSTPGPRSICRARDGWASTRPRACSRPRVTCRWPRRRSRRRPRPSAGACRRRRSSSSIR